MSGDLTILDASHDPAIFACWFKDRATWEAWFCFLAVLFGLPLSDEQLTLYHECTGRTTPPSGAFLEAWLICGRRAGKSFVLALIAVFLSCFIDWKPYLVQGEVGRIVIIAADRKQARTIFNYIGGFLKNIPMLSGMIARETLDTFDLTNGLTIEIQAASFRTVRGYSLIAALCDEAAFWSTDDGSANPDIEIIRSIRPALASIRGSMLLVASSPYAEAGALWNAYTKHHGKDESRVLTWQASTRTMNPSIPQAVVDEAFESDPAAAAAEFGAQFRRDVSGYIPAEIIKRAIDVGVATRPPVRGVSYRCFFDAASGVGTDSFTAAWGHCEDSRIIIDHIFVRRPPFDASQAFAEFAAICRSYGTTEVCSDRYSIGFLISECQRNGLTHTPSDLDKSRLYLHSLPQLTSERVRLPDVAEIVPQFTSLERRTGSEGRDKVDGRGGKPEDVANAIAGCIWLLSQPMSAADGWNAFYKAQSEGRRYGGEIDHAYSDVDDVRAGDGSDWHFRSEADYIDIRVPEAMVRDRIFDRNGVVMAMRWRDGNAYIQMLHDDAREFLRLHHAWRDFNPDAVRKLGPDKVPT